MTRHGFGCTCLNCTRHAALAAEESRRIRDHNRSAYATGPRKWIPPLSKAFDRHHAFDWMVQPHPGELEYLRHDEMVAKDNGRRSRAAAAL